MLAPFVEEQVLICIAGGALKVEGEDSATPGSRFFKIQVLGGTGRRGTSVILNCGFVPLGSLMSKPWDRNHAQISV